MGADYSASRALILAAMRRLPHYIGNLKLGAWQQSGLKTASMPPNFGLGLALQGRTLGLWGYGRIGTLVAGYGRAFGMRVVVWGSESSRERARADGHGDGVVDGVAGAEGGGARFPLTYHTVTRRNMRFTTGAAQADGSLNPALPPIAVLYTLYARACDPVLGFLKSTGLYSTEQIIDMVLSTCFDGLRAR